LALNYAGAFGAVILFGILPALMVWSGRYIKGISGEKIVPGGKITLGAIILFAAVAFRKPLLSAIPAYLAIAMIILISYNFHYNRGVHERAYFLNIQKATYYSETLVDRGDGLTQMIASLEKSKEAVEILKRHQLGVFRPGAVNVEEFSE
jgi:hypothetical protein